MNKQLRKAVIAGNWKMNKTPSQAKTLLGEIAPLVKDADCEVIACVPYVDLCTAIEAVKGTNIKIGAENCHWAESGAFTGEISTGMLTELGVEYVVLGHSERRQYFGETDETVNKRTKAALAAGLKPIVCVGELLWERECNITEEVIARQIKLDLFDVSAEDVKKTIIAYEPVWAIGTGKNATAEQAEEVCAFVDFVTQESLRAGENASKYVQGIHNKNPKNIVLRPGNRVRYTVPQHIQSNESETPVSIMFRPTDVYRNVQITAYSNDVRIKSVKKKIVRPGEMQVIELNPDQLGMVKDNLTVSIEIPEEDIE